MAIRLQVVAGSQRRRKQKTAKMIGGGSSLNESMDFVVACVVWAVVWSQPLELP